jgi:hypothetical protein
MFDLQADKNTTEGIYQILERGVESITITLALVVAAALALSSLWETATITPPNSRGTTTTTRCAEILGSRLAIDADLCARSEVPKFQRFKV